MSTSTVSIEQLAVNTIRTLSMDAVQKANSGHPGTPMALAPVVYTLWNEVLKYDPADPLWPSRDRFVLSAGHASMLLYSILHLTGVRDVDAAGRVLDAPAIPLDDIRNFRQLHSRCAGHPEHGEAPGIETTTGPLGQGLGNSVGMAISERWLAARLNRADCEIFNYNVYAVCSDGDLMEGISSEAASIAGHLKLSNLCWIYDDNKITIEGSTDLAFSEEVARRFEGYRWNTIRVDDANDLDSLRAAFKKFQATTDRPTLIIVRSHIAWGSPNKHDTHGAHGAPLGADEIKLTKAVYGWPENESFLVPEDVLSHFQEGIGARGRELRQQWEERFTAWKKKYPELAQKWDCMRSGELPMNWDADLTEVPADPKGIATRKSSAKALNQVAQRVPWLIGGSADLAESTFTTLTFDAAQGSFEADNYAGSNFHFGIREHGMAAVLNGMALSHIRPYGSTFLVFSDYCRPSIRLSAIMKTPVLYIFTHDSIGVGEDGPTHQPIEHVAALRAIPNLWVFRPGDANEVVESWRAIMPLRNHPVALILTRQNLPTLDRTKYAPATGAQRGAYVLADAPNGKPSVLLMATGSELAATVVAYERLKEAGIAARVVSMPCWELFESQDAAYRDSVLPPSVTARVAVEAAAEMGWSKYLGPRGRFVGMHGFGASAPAELLMKHFGITTDGIVEQAKAAVAKNG